MFKWLYSLVAPTLNNGDMTTPRCDDKGSLRVVQTDSTGASVVVASSDTAGADAESNTSTRGRVVAWLKGFNGTAWDRLRAGVTTIDTTFTGMLNVLPQAVHETTPTTRTTGQRGWLQSFTDGSLRVYLGHLISGEFQATTATNSRLRVEQVWEATRITTATTTTVLSGAGTFGGIIIGKHVATGIITVYDNTAASGTIKLVVTTGAAILSDPPLASIAGIVMGTGITVVTSQAEDITILYRANS